MSVSNPALFFVDSNIWLYALIVGQDFHKESVAQNIIQTGSIIISTQVVNEVCVNAIKKQKLNEQEIRKLIRSFFGKYRVIEVNKNILIKAFGLRENYKLSYWDSLIVASALTAKAEVLYSEDMHNGLVVDNQLKIVNPF